MKYVIQNTETGRFLESLVIGIDELDSYYWHEFSCFGLQFGTRKEAAATIEFICDVLDWEMAELLEVVEVSG